MRAPLGEVVRADRTTGFPMAVRPNMLILLDL